MTNKFDTAGESVTDGEAVEWLESTLSPIAARERIEALDVLRGCALLGILVVNIRSFASLGYDPSTAANISSLDRQPPTGRLGNSDILPSYRLLPVCRQ
jgi:hypothetical protein